VAAKVTIENICSTQPVAELAPSLMDKLYEDKDYLSKALVANLFKKSTTQTTVHKK
jgi:hypothetical protein